MISLRTVLGFSKRVKDFGIHFIKFHSLRAIITLAASKALIGLVGSETGGALPN